MNLRLLALQGMLALMLLACYLATLGFVRLATPLARLHAVTFLNLAGGGCMTVAAILTDGLSTRSLKCLGTWLILVLSGALLSHASGRALLLREAARR